MAEFDLQGEAAAPPPATVAEGVVVFVVVVVVVVVDAGLEGEKAAQQPFRRAKMNGVGERRKTAVQRGEAAAKLTGIEG